VSDEINKYSVPLKAYKIVRQIRLLFNTFSFRDIYLHTNDNFLYKTRVLSSFFFVIKWTHGKYLDLEDIIKFIMYLTNNK